MGAVSNELQHSYAQTAAEGITGAADQSCGWIVDLRGNPGGTMYRMLSGLIPLLPNGTVTIYEGGAGRGGTDVSVGAVAKIPDHPVAVLQDGDTVSSGEAVLTAFKGLDNVRSFGTASAGYSSANTVQNRIQRACDLKLLQCCAICAVQDACSGGC